MRYHAVHRIWLRTPPAAGASDAVIGTWVRLSCHAAEIEAGIPNPRATRQKPLGTARIQGCRQWTPRTWLSTTDTTKKNAEALVRARIARWEGDDLVVEGYDSWGEKRTRRIRHDNEKPEDIPSQTSGELPGEDAGQGRGYVGEGDVPEDDAQDGWADAMEGSQS